MIATMTSAVLFDTFQQDFSRTIQTSNMSDPMSYMTKELAAMIQSEQAKSGGDMSKHGFAARAQAAAARNENARIFRVHWPKTSDGCDMKPTSKKTWVQAVSTESSDDSILLGKSVIRRKDRLF